MTIHEKRRITAEDLYQFQLIKGARISPDGKNVLFSVHRVDQKSEKKYSNLWVAPVEDGEPRQFTYGDHNDGGPAWSPDGSQVAFLSNRGDKEKPPQVYLLPFYGGEARPLTKIEGEIGKLTWSPDGKKLLTTVRKQDAEVLEREKDEQKKKLGTVKRHYDRVFYKLDGYGYLPHERTHIWVIDAMTGEATQLTDHAVYDEIEPVWSPDGSQIACLSNRSANPDFEGEKTDVYIIPALGGEFQRVETPVGDKGSLSWSRDGKWLAYVGTLGIEDWKDSKLYIVPVDSSQPARNLTAAYDIHVAAWTINDMGEPEMMLPYWSKDGKSVLFQVAIHGSTVLKRISLDGKDLEDVIGEGGVVANFTFDRDETRLAYFYGQLNDPGQVRVRNLKTGAERQLTTVNQDLLSSLDIGQVEEVWFKGPDGNDLQGWILTPPGFDPAKKYPSIMEIHGGPLTQYGRFFMHEFYYLASKDYVVYFCNPRGGRGYGETHATAIHGAWGSVDYTDLMAWADYMAQKPYIDVTRMGVTGGSYGGYMTVWIIGHTQRFKAAVTQRCVSNFVSMWGSSDFNWAFQRELGDKAPFEDLQKYWKHSPIAYIGNAKTPTLVIHNEFDLRCPIEQGEQVFVALKRLGVDTEFVRFPDEFHGLSRSGRTDRRIARLNAILGWFEKYLK